MRLAIVGSRNFNDFESLEKAVCHTLAEWNTHPSKLVAIVSGGAPGADKLAEEFADKWKIKKEIFPVTKEDWEKYDKAAGPRRNQLIVDDCTHMIAFPSHSGKGTQSSITKARNAKKPLKILWVD